MLRRTIGVSESAKANVKIKPAPPTAQGPLPEEGLGGFGGLEDHMFVNQAEVGGGEDPWLNWSDIKKKASGGGVEHDEL